MMLELTIIYLMLTVASSNPTPSPPSAFVVSPKNTTVLEGHSTILKCKTRETIHTCEWFYVDKELDFFDSRIQPMPIKTFRATNENDCSILFSSAKLRQTGQWVCKGFAVHARKYIMSSPAFLEVIQQDDNTDPEGRTEPTLEGAGDYLPDDSTGRSESLFPGAVEGHVINSHLGYEVLLDCQATFPLEKCAWITPEGIKYKREGPKPMNHNHIEIVGDMKEGNCSLLTTVKYQDEGNWRCIVSAENEIGDRVGPLIHLHIMELGPHSNEGSNETIDEETGTSLVTILVGTLIILLFIVLLLSFYIYRHRSRNPPHTQFVSSGGSQADYNTYACTWLPTFGIKEQQLLNDQRIKEDEDRGSNHYTRYLDMTGSAAPGREGYVMFPHSSIRSSTSSRTTLSTLPAGRHSSLGNNSGHPSISESLPSMSSVEEFPFDKKGLVRSPSNYSTGHLYEEIKYGQKENVDQLKMHEDKEGYMLPKPSTQIHIMRKVDYTDKTGNLQKAPPYSKVAESGLVRANVESNWASNPTYGLDSKERGKNASNPTYGLEMEKENISKNEQGSYDLPQEPPVPIRIDSVKDDPLANYDIPSKVPTPVPSGEEDNISNA